MPNPMITQKPYVPRIQKELVPREKALLMQNEEDLDADQLTSSFVYLSSSTTNGSLFVEENGLRNYGQSLSTACETVTTSYNNYYIENFENIICNYFIYSLRRKYPNVKIGCLKNLVYNHVYDEVLVHSEPSSILDGILCLFDSDVASSLSSFLNPLILEMKNCMPTLPVSKYENLNMAQPSQDAKGSVSKFMPPRLFGIFPGAKQEKQINESPFDHNQRQFFQTFDFKKLGFRRRKNKTRFEEGDCKKMPLVIFSDSLRNKDHVKFKGLRRGVSNKICRQLKRREELGELLLLDINEYKPQRLTCNSCFKQELENLKRGGGDDVKKIHQNMLTIARSIWISHGRPNVFKRQLATSNVVASSHSGEALA
ncbi:hypothetical protein CU097_010872 [Rhizopus azygosporus]|uniref:Uncharacterized protein n=1 Tax=Rhizopus azygosporus TaxID=86630 RepID=A0A367JIU8_RHIAZ|nr:hypothetical protein CU097_010872 [Rhizopus azygosporus]